MRCGKNEIGSVFHSCSPIIKAPAAQPGISTVTDMPFSLQMKVRDYECDMQGIVNNAVYQHYLEHARHEYLLSRGLSFAELTARGIIIVVVRAEIDYRRSLRAGEDFLVTVTPQRPSTRPARTRFTK